METAAGLLIELDLTGRLALVVGLGSVGRRKAATLLDAGARVVGVDPHPTADLALGPELLPRLDAAQLVHLSQPYDSSLLNAACLVVAAATPGVNQHVVHDASALGLWVISASDPEAGNARLPAVWRRQGLALAVSTGGASPALAGALRDRAAAALGDDAAGLVDVFKRLRPEVLTRLAGRPAARRALFRDWADPSWIDLVQVEGAEGVERAVRRIVDEALARPDLREESA